ncbi:MAG: SDR family oxidoreductase [Trueperaceae bacterium]|nr:SDR family oxidoreductase [Trueperaceae bacterium]
MPRGGVVLVTGVGQGFGRAVALGWGRAGYDVVCADRDVELASKTAAEIEENGGQAIPIQIDVTVGMDVRHAFAKIDELFGRLEGVVHVASRSSSASPLALTDNEFTELVDDTLRSSQLLLRTAARSLERSWIVIVAPPASADAPQNAMVRGGLARLAAAFGARSDALRVNVVVPSRSASDPVHDARLVDTVLFLGGEDAEGIRGLELAVDLPPPPRVVERLLPEIQAALDDRVRQDDLEAEMWSEQGEADDDADGDDDSDDGDDASSEGRRRRDTDDGDDTSDLIDLPPYRPRDAW